MPATTAAEIVARTGLWPPNTVPYSQVGTASPTGHRPDCSGYASMALGLPTPGENTVTLVTEGHVRRIEWAELDAGDLVMLGGPNTAGNDGHVAVVVAVHRDRGTYEVLEQSGGLGPDRNTYRIGSASRPGMVPYRSTYLTEPTPQEEPMIAHLWQDTDDQLWYVTGPLAVRQRVSAEQAKTLLYYAGGAGKANLPGFTLVDMRPFGKADPAVIPGVDLAALGSGTAPHTHEGGVTGPVVGG